IYLSLSFYIHHYFFQCSRPHRHLHSFPTRRSSDLAALRRRATIEAPTGRVRRRPEPVARKTNSIPDVRVKTRQISFFEKAWLARSEEHTSELQSQSNLVCRLLLEKKKKNKKNK